MRTATPTMIEQPTLLHESWSSRDVLRGFDLPLDLDAARSSNVRDEMWRNVVAEYDARHLSRYIRTGSVAISDYFVQFEQLWSGDECNHYIGLRAIFSRLFRLDEQQIDSLASARIPDFTNIEAFLVDEFSICACLAYDELASTKGYADAFPLYDGFGDARVSKWIRLVARDEMYHAINARSLLKSLYAERLDEVPQLLRRVVSAEPPETAAYKATFLFDHGEAEGDNPFSQPFLQNCANDVCRMLGLPPAFER